MPALDAVDLDQLRATASQRCDECSRLTYKSYCREHDEFFWFGHALLCRAGQGDNAHRDHRIC